MKSIKFLAKMYWLAGIVLQKIVTLCTTLGGDYIGHPLPLVKLCLELYPHPLGMGSTLMLGTHNHSFQNKIIFCVFKWVNLQDYPSPIYLKL